MIPALVLGGLNIGMGAMRANQQAKQRQAEAQMRAAEIEASPWTNRAPSTQVSTDAPSVWAEMAGGGINTLGQLAAIKNAGLFETAPKKVNWNEYANLSKMGMASGRPYAVID